MIHRTRHNAERRAFGGLPWALDDDGRVFLFDAEEFHATKTPWIEYHALGYTRTRGEPRTVRTLRQDYGPDIDEAASITGIPAAWIAAMVTIEAARVRRSLSFDPISLRHEPGYTSDQETPHRVSAGLMQTLLSTARAMRERHNTLLVGSKVPYPARVSDLYIPRTSLILGATYMMHQAEKHGRDPILLVASYNAGGVYRTTRNPWGLRTYGETRIPKFVAFLNDWIDEFGPVSS